MKGWQCKWCGHQNPPNRNVSICAGCLNGRTQAIEDMIADKNGLPRRVLKRRFPA